MNLAQFEQSKYVSERDFTYTTLFNEKALALQKKASKQNLLSGLGNFIGTIGGAILGGPGGAAAGSQIGSAVGQAALAVGGSIG
jgi:outer membrane lipoprotein SlyB